MKITFEKYHGAGNDLIIIDDRKGSLKLTKDNVALLCHRRFGIGADGLMLLQESRAHDFKMTYFNADGNEGSLCGNGGRCIVFFAKLKGLINSETIFEAIKNKDAEKARRLMESHILHSADNTIERLRETFPALSRTGTQ